MCETGVNADQLRRSIAQVDDSLGMAQKWAEDLHALADHAHESEAGSHLAQVTVLLGQARTKLDAASESLGGDLGGVTIEVV